MFRSLAKRRIQAYLLPFSFAALWFAPGIALGQQAAAHVWHPAGASSGVRPAPVAPAPPLHPIVMMTPPRTATVARWRGAPMSAARFVNAPHGTVAVQPIRVLPLQGDLRQAFRGPFFFQPYFFGAFPWGLGYAGTSFASQSDRLPLGFGLWPACDSANTPGVFWTVGPCFGIGDYSQELSPSNEYAATPSSIYLLPLFFAETQPESGESAQPNLSATESAPTMLLYKTDGSTIPASDWWVAQGRLQYITDSGVTGSMDLPQLDLEQTIRQNETRGLRFHLRFTPPSGQFPASIRP